MHKKCLRLLFLIGQKLTTEISQNLFITLLSFHQHIHQLGYLMHIYIALFIACLSFSKLKLITTILFISSGFHLLYLCWWLCSPSLIATAQLTQQNLSGGSSFCCPSSTTSILLRFADAVSAAAGLQRQSCPLQTGPVKAASQVPIAEIVVLTVL